MSSPITSARPGDTSASVPSRPLASSVTELPTSQGRTSISDEVVQTIAVIAARRVTGVHSIGGGAERYGAVRERTPGPEGQNPGQGVSVEIGGLRAVVDLDVVVEYGVAMVPLMRALRRDVVEWVQVMTGLQVTEVNITVRDVHLPSDDVPAPTPVRDR